VSLSCISVLQHLQYDILNIVVPDVETAPYVDCVGQSELDRGVLSFVTSTLMLFRSLSMSRSAEAGERELRQKAALTMICTRVIPTVFATGVGDAITLLPSA
jgi:hypothetical protein